MITSDSCQLDTAPPVLEAEIDEFEDHPLRTFFSASKRFAQSAHTIEFSVRVVLLRLRDLDNCPRHDTELDEETWLRLSGYHFDCTYFPVVHSLNSVGASVDRLEDALHRVAGVYRGELKVKTEDRIARALAVLHDLQSDLEATLPHMPMPRKPYLIRQQSLGHLARLLEDFLDDVCRIRRSLNNQDIDQALLSNLIEQEEKLRRMKAGVCRWRDNPSQKMACKLGELLGQTIFMTEAFRKLKLDVMQACSSAGMDFFDRIDAMVSDREVRVRYEQAH